MQCIKINIYCPDTKLYIPITNQNFFNKNLWYHEHAFMMCLFVFQRFKKAAAQHPIENAAATHQHIAAASASTK